MSTFTDPKKTPVSNNDIDDKQKSVKEAEEEIDESKLTDDELIDVVAKRILKEYHKAFEELAK